MLRSLRPNLGLNASRGPRPTIEHRQTDRPRRKWLAIQDEEGQKGKKVRCQNWAKRCERLNELSALKPELSKALDMKGGAGNVIRKARGRRELPEGTNREPKQIDRRL